MSENRRWEVKCPNCKEDFSTPYYTSTWSNWKNTSICLKCVFHQPNKTQELFKVLEQEEQELIAYYTSKKKTEELNFLKKQLKDWNINLFINTIKKATGGASK